MRPSELLISSSISSLFLFASKKQLIIIEDKIEQRLQIGKRQLNDIRYNMHKKLCMVTASVFMLKSVFLYCLLIVYKGSFSQIGVNFIPKFDIAIF